MTSYEPGTPAWVDAGVPDTDAAAAFYGGLFGWVFDDADEAMGGYRQARLRGHAVAGFGPQMGPMPYWATYIAVADADATVAAAIAAGGQVIVEPMDIPGQGRMAVLTDPAGTPFSLWQPTGHPGAGLVNETGTLCWNELTTRQPEEAKAFYGEVFGWTARSSTEGSPGYTEWYLGERAIGGMMPMEGEMWDGIPDHWMVYFAVDDTDAACAKVTELGGGVQVPPFDIPVGRIAVVSDTAGTHFSIIALGPERAAAAAAGT